jgi:transcriptional regulator of acetoin/glycerol metabolism
MLHIAITLNDLDDRRPRPVLVELEEKAIAHALEACGGNITETAARLGIARQSLQRKIRRLP